MKKYINNIVKYSIVLSVLLISGSCEDYLEKSSDSDISSEEAFKNFENFLVS